MKNLFVIIAIILLTIIAFFIDFEWTKSFLEDLTGKEVKNSTVIWTMIKTDKK